MNEKSDRRPRRRSAEDNRRYASTNASMKLRTGVFTIDSPTRAASPAAAVPASAKMPAPMIAPMPRAGQIKCGERAFQFALGRRGLAHQQLRTFGSKKFTHQLRRWLFRKRKMASCHFAFDSVNVNFLRASGFGLRLATERAYARCA